MGAQGRAGKGLPGTSLSPWLKVGCTLEPRVGPRLSGVWQAASPQWRLSCSWKKGHRNRNRTADTPEVFRLLLLFHLQETLPHIQDMCRGRPGGTAGPLLQTEQCHVDRTVSRRPAGKALLLEQEALPAGACTPAPLGTTSSAPTLWTLPVHQGISESWPHLSCPLGDPYGPGDGEARAIFGGEEDPWTLRKGGHTPGVTRTGSMDKCHLQEAARKEVLGDCGLWCYRWGSPGALSLCPHPPPRPGSGLSVLPQFLWQPLPSRGGPRVPALTPDTPATLHLSLRLQLCQAQARM